MSKLDNLNLRSYVGKEKKEKEENELEVGGWGVWFWIKKYFADI